MNGRPLVPTDHCTAPLPERSITLTIRGYRPILHMPTQAAKDGCARRLTGLSFEEWDALIREREAVAV